jgi:hypothetical protein
MAIVDTLKSTMRTELCECDCVVAPTKRMNISLFDT